MAKQVTYNGVTRSFPDDATDEEIRAALEAADRKPSLLERVSGYLPSPRTAAQIGGATVGGAVGSFGGPFGTVAGGAAGAGVGESLYQLVQKFRGAEDAPQSLNESVGRIGEAASGGALQEVVGYGLPKAAQGLASTLYRRTLKPSTALPVEEAARISQNLLDEGIPISRRGASRVQRTIQRLSRDVDQTIARNPAAEVDPFAAASRADPSIDAFLYKDLQKDYAAAGAEKTRFIKEHSTPVKFSPYNPAQTSVPPVQTKLTPKPIPASRAQAMKKAIYEEVYPVDTTSGYKVTRQQIGRGLKEELETQFPTIGPVNARIGRLSEGFEQLEPAVNRIANREIMPTGRMVTGGVVNAATQNPILAALATLKPGSRTAILLNRLGRGSVFRIPKFAAIPMTRALFEANR